MREALDAETLNYYLGQVKYVKEQLPQEIASVQAQRLSAARKVHESLTAIRNVYQELFAAVQQLIQSSVLIKEGFKLTFNSSIIERTFTRGISSERT